jgi:hypothetical protein
MTPALENEAFNLCHLGLDPTADAGMLIPVVPVEEKANGRLIEWTVNG